MENKEKTKLSKGGSFVSDEVVLQVSVSLTLYFLLLSQFLTLSKK